ncbi:acyltransferase [Bombilactobacillus folatiphilus]|uniref:Acyltransferase n=1 Tax=Bombilactobacillus folatiphilus TaxID=2923362 RepID=A0ABY4P8F7_9LACO|nr:acyltransferase [Bombilactobacillus folatiphilus]UQS81942.1 acyltransferase [Bombilactobacillus folatiphilus]
MQTKQIDSIDVLKILAALAVVSIHTGFVDVLNHVTHTVIPSMFVRLAVPIFFIIASYFLARHIQRHHDRLSALKSYTWRIGKLYLFWIILYGYYIVRDAWPGFQQNGATVKWWGLAILHFVLIGPPTMLVGWYLNALLFGIWFVYWWFQKKQRLGFVLALLIFGGIVIFSGYFPVKLSFLIACTLFVGPSYIYLGQWLANLKQLPSWHKLILSTSFVLLLTYVEIAYVTAHNGHTDQLFMYLFLAPLIVMIFFKVPLKLPHARWWRNFSTFMYLSHYLLMKIIYNFLYYQVHSSILRFVIVVGLSFLAYVVVCLLQKTKLAAIFKWAY